jgi:hypothetical protein
MTRDQREAQWREEFERMGLTEVRKMLPVINPEAKTQLALKWLRAQEEEKEEREAAVLDWTKRGANAAIIGAIAAVIGAIGAAIAAWPVVRDWVVH